MTFRTLKTFGWGLAAVAACTAVLLSDCRTPSTTGSQTLESGADAYNGFVDLFTKVIGRKPQSGADGAGTDFAIFDANQDAMVDKLLASSQWQQEGFFNVHRDRLVLTPYQQSPQWTKQQHPSYCALTREMQEVAQEDRAGSGYWALLNYQDRWVPLPSTISNCFAGTTVGALQAAFAAAANGGGNGGGGTAGPVPQTPAPADGSAPAPPSTAPAVDATAQSCVQNAFVLATYQTDFTNAIKGLGPDQAAKAPLDTPQGADMLAKAIAAVVTPQGTAAADVKVVIDVDGGGRPLMTEEYDPAPESTSCSFRDLPADLSTWARTPNSTLMVKAKVSPKVVGYMANPFWLARNPTNQKNRQMHRARVVMFSFQCREVSPAAAALAGGNAQVVPALANYFAPGDIHAQASQACYDCHATMQPLGNFFTALDRNDDVQPGGITPAGDDDDSTNSGARYSGLRYFQQFGALELPGGYWTFTEPGQGSFFGTDGVDYDLKGLQGLANVLSDKNFAGPAQCVVNTAWSTVFGSEYKMPDTVKAQALQAFNQGNATGAPSMTEAMRWILKSPYGKAYFSSTQGRPAFEALLNGSSNQVTCDAASTQAGLGKAQQRCYTCHNSHHKSGGVAFFNFPDKAPLTLTEDLRHRAFCEVSSDDMPADGALQLDDKKAVLCYMHPTTEANPVCTDTTQPNPDSPVHTLPN